jgi:hypothetical protein
MLRAVATIGFVGGAFIVGCGDEDADPRFASPEATIRTLMTTYGVEDMSQEEVQQIMMTRGRFELRDEATYRACFDDYAGMHDEGLAGFVFGTIVAGKDQLEITHAQGKAHVYPNPERRDRSVVLVERDGEWKISLRDSVPSDVRRALLEEYRRASDRAKRSGAPE